MKRTALKRSVLEGIEIRLLLQGIYEHYGVDFQDYDFSLIRNQVRDCMREENVTTVSGLQEKILHDRASLKRFVAAVSRPREPSPVDADFFRFFREQIIPVLRTYPSVRIWQAGCGSLNEIYWLAIIVREEGLSDKTHLYATDSDEQVLERARDGLFSTLTLPYYQDQYLRSGGKTTFDTYVVTGRKEGVFNSVLKRNIIFAQHDLTSDSSFNEFNLIVSRHVLNRFNPVLQHRAHRTFYESLQLLGILNVEPKESLQRSPFETCYQELDSCPYLFRKIR
ncbi:MAG: CheR family methyltransferase [Verrucomicrobiota bacterium]|jgi:chemotaxis protein methyltransferase CheR